MNRLYLFFLFIFLFLPSLKAQVYTYDDSRGAQGFSLLSQDRQGAGINYSIREFSLEDITVRGAAMKHILLADHFLPGDEGAPDLPGSGRFIAVPRGAQPVLHIISLRKETYQDIDIAPAPRIPLDNEDGQPVYNRDEKLYSTNAFYPAEPVKLSEMTTIRGVDAVVLGITPFQYNPVTRELVVYRDIEVEIEFSGGTGIFGEERLRSRWWDPIMNDLFLNAASLPEVDYSRRFAGLKRATGCEYLIICPDGDDFQAWADSIRLFRTQQGILTQVVTISEVGGNQSPLIEAYINDAYNNWDIPPAACLILGDHGYNSDQAVLSNLLYDHPDDYNPYISDNPYADVTGDLLPDIAFARITARNAEELALMVGKALSYERNPPTSEAFYDHPITALGWQTERWFQICSEAVGGYFRNVLGKHPVRINDVYGGDPDIDPWSTAANTEAVIGTFGPDGLGYIPATPAELGSWQGGDAEEINDAVNDGAFILQHRDHGNENGWGEPYYTKNEIKDLHNTDLTFVMSINCQTGKFNAGDDCFGEVFHRYQYDGQASGALGVVAPTEISYSFVNDVYTWGFYDNLFPDFFPQFGSTPEPRGMYPAFGNAAGKYFLYYSSWPSNPQHKAITYKLFHHHGDAFTCLYSEVPQNLAVIHDSVQLAGLSAFTIQADEGSFIGLSVDGELIGAGTGTGEMVDIPIIAQNPPHMIDVVVTKGNYYRYHDQVQVIPPNGAYVISEACQVDDAGGNNNGLLDYGETAVFDMTFRNLGSENAQNVSVTISSEDEYVTVTDNTTEAGDVPSGQMTDVPDAFSVSVAENVPDGHILRFLSEATDGDSVWLSTFNVKAHAPVIKYSQYTISDPEGNNNGRLDPGETVEINVSLYNEGGADAYNVKGKISCDDPYVEIISDSAMFGLVPAGSSVSKSFTVTAYVITVPGHEAGFDLSFSGDMNVNADADFSLFIGLFPVLVLDLDENHNSGNIVKSAIDECRIFAEYKQEMPEDLSQYNTIFLCLGTYSDNHVLSTVEAEPLTGFLNNGGNLYMEGGDTWYFDYLYYPTELQPMFRIQGSADGNADIISINGVDSTFTEGFSFFFNGDEEYIDRIVPEDGASVIFRNSNPVFNTAIAYDGGTYRTIGSSTEFGGLMNNLNSTRKDLILKYLEFFGMEPVTEIPETPQGDTLVCTGMTSSVYSTQPVPEAEYYIWELNPPGAGIIHGWGLEVTVDWTPGYLGSSTLRVCGMNENGLGPVSASTLIRHFNSPTAIVAFSDSTICAGDTTYANITLTGTSPWHMVVSLGGYEVTLNPNKPNMDGIPLSPTSDLAVSIVSLSDANGCVVTGFEPEVIHVSPIPFTPAMPVGPDSVDVFAGTQSQYQVTDSVPAEGYEWMLQPAGAGSLSADESGMQCTVEWATGFTGAASLKVRGVNDCGESEYADPLTINVINTSGINDDYAATSITVIPNPNNGIFRIGFEKFVDKKAEISLINLTGETARGPFLLNPGPGYTYSMDCRNLPDGLYLLQIITDKATYIRKVVIQR